jgi:protein subunit release factor B
VKFPADTPITQKKLNQLRARIERLEINLAEVNENFTRSPGPGGQKVNKTSSTVQLKYEPLDISVKWHTERSRAMNRFFALRELVDEIEERVSPETSKRLADREKQRKRKRNRKRKAKKKYS